jgi:general secretion pathway protein D
VPIRLDSDVNLLANPRIRARNREKAKILIGDRVPNITSTITATGFSSESITYIDVGLKLDFEPTIYLDNEVAIKVTLEVSNIVDKVTTKTGTVAYQIGTRTASSVLRLKDGENQLLAGLISDEDRRTASKLPFLGDIPILGRLFGSHSDEGIKTEIVLVDHAAHSSQYPARRTLSGGVRRRYGNQFPGPSREQRR